MKQESPSMQRQRWLETLVSELRPWFKKSSLTVPDNVRVSIGWPRGSHGRGTAIGQCWDMLASTDKHHEVFISPALRDSVTIVATMVHELVHATVGTAAGHKGAFKSAALAVGLEGKMTATVPGANLIAWAQDFVRDHGDYPGGALNDARRKKQSTRLLKCECPECGYVCRVTSKWLDQAGAPICPTDEISMNAEDENGDE